MDRNEQLIERRERERVLVNERIATIQENKVGYSNQAIEMIDKHLPGTTKKSLGKGVSMHDNLCQLKDHIEKDKIAFAEEVLDRLKTIIFEDKNATDRDK